MASEINELTPPALSSSDEVLNKTVLNGNAMHRRYEVKIMMSFRQFSTPNYCDNENRLQSSAIVMALIISLALTEIKQ